MASAESGEVHKGLRNLTGQNNCFLNAAIQTLWHLPSFRERLATAETLASRGGEPSLLPAMQSLFANYLYGEDNVLPADEVRLVLGSLYSRTGQFQIGEIDDATECLEAILHSIHCEHVDVPLSEGGDEVACSPPCAACSVFKCAYFDQRKCKRCGATSDPMPTNNFVYRVWVAECIAGPQQETFQAALRRLWETGYSGPLTCPDAARSGAAACSGPCCPERWCISLPKVFTANIVWPTSHPSGSVIAAMLRMLRCSIDLSEVFSLPTAAPSPPTPSDGFVSPLATGQIGGLEEAGSVPAPRTLYRFCGMICYYGKHYVSLFARRERDKRSESYGRWLLFDDSTIRELGSWTEVKSFCIASRYQPTIVWFEQVPEGEEPWWMDDVDPKIEEQTGLNFIGDMVMDFFSALGASPSVARPATPAAGHKRAAPQLAPSVDRPWRVESPTIDASPIFPVATEDGVFGASTGGDDHVSTFSLSYQPGQRVKKVGLLLDMAGGDVVVTGYSHLKGGIKLPPELAGVPLMHRVVAVGDKAVAGMHLGNVQRLMREAIDNTGTLRLTVAPGGMFSAHV
uniref:USP domain-containing protein n=1 Tax=Rhizochromulina marina TaxID=1034831 RepID=A0A7S2SPQ2_9STRA|mmetsp:Transcript_3708/g.10859  ORF Transcript_3708/g.10859 Transcript_3708/m.10859 type:complete len:570 (+) Transcript_3708:37-1746(+)